MNWLIRSATTIGSDISRIGRNVDRLDELKKAVHELALFGLASQSGSFQILKDILDHRLVLGRPRVHAKLQEALIGENNQKVVLDAPTRFMRILNEAESLIDIEIGKEKRELRKLQAMTDETT